MMARLALVLAIVVSLVTPSVAAGDARPVHETTRVAEGVYTFRWHLHRNMFVVTDEGVILTDPISPAAARVLMDEVRRITDKPIRYVVYSHEHWDHVLGGRIFKEAGATFVSHAKCLPRLRARPHPDLVLPDVTFSGSAHDLRLGGTTLELRHFGPSHGECLIVMRLPREKLLFAVDLVTPHTIGFRILPDYQPLELIRTLKAIEQELEFDRIIPGHLDPVAPASAVREQREYYEDLMAAVGQAWAAGIRDPAELVRRIRLPKYEHWFGYAAWLPLNVERAWAYYHMGW